MPRALWVVALAFGVSGCWGNVATAFPPGLEPLEVNTAPAPAGVDSVAIVGGETSEFVWAHGRGYVSAPAGAVWAALREPAVVASRRQTDHWSYMLIDDSTYEYEFTLHYEVNEFIDVTWDEDWRYGTLEGDPAEPTLAIIRWQKTFGSTFIDLLEGALNVAPRGDGETEVQFVEHVQAQSTSEGNIRTTIQDQFDALVARSHGLDLPPL